MAPNKRSDDKVNVNAWVPRELKARFEAIARARGITVSQLLTELVEQQVDEQNHPPKNRHDRNAGNGN